MNIVNVDACVKCVESNRDMIVGIKLRLSDTIADRGKNEEEAYRLEINAMQHICMHLYQCQFERKYKLLQ